MISSMAVVPAQAGRGSGSSSAGTFALSVHSPASAGLCGTDRLNPGRLVEYNMYL
jgi:hypothetical protein